jgi:DNA-binding response OmpR family regulator
MSNTAEARVVAREPPATGRNVIELGELRIDADAHRVYVGTEEIPLTWLEFKLLITLAKRPDRVQERGQLLTEIWQVKAENVTRTVDTHVKRLRDKLGPTGRIIQTVRGIGYRLSQTPSIQDIDGRCSVRDRAPRSPALSGPRLVESVPGLVHAALSLEPNGADR